MSNILIGILVGLAIHSVWSSVWLIIYSEKSDDWMYVVAGGLAIWLIFGVCQLGNLIYDSYHRYNWKAVVVDNNGDKYWCESEDVDVIIKQYDVKPAFDFVKTIEYKPYKHKSYSVFYQSNPRYVHRKVACKYPKLKYHFRDAKKMPNCDEDMRGEKNEKELL